jgi:hypothetical protein
MKLNSVIEILYREFNQSVNGLRIYIELFKTLS